MDSAQIEREIASMPPLTEEEGYRTVRSLLRNFRRRNQCDCLVLLAYTPEQAAILDVLRDIGSWCGDVRKVERRVNEKLRKGRLPSPNWFSELSPSPVAQTTLSRLIRRACYNVYEPLPNWERFENSIGLKVWYRYPSRAIINKIEGRESVLALARPRMVHLDSEGLFHNEDGPAFISATNQKSYLIHGQLVPPKLFEAPEELSDQQVRRLIEIPNVTTREVVLEKIGIARALRALKVIKLDHWREYTLYTTPYNKYRGAISFKIFANCLTMVNPTTGKLHLEWVPQSCKSVKAALKFRNRWDGAPVVLA